MRVSAQDHYDRTRWICDLVVLLGIVAAGGLLLIAYWERIAEASWAVKAGLLLVLAALATWPRLIVSRLLCEIVREATSARCLKCGGRTRFDASMEGSFNTAPVSYTCRQCGFQELLKTAYCDEVPRGGGDCTGGDGLGGGGG